MGIFFFFFFFFYNTQKKKKPQREGGGGVRGVVGGFTNIKIPKGGGVQTPPPLRTPLTS